jgi:hypothetical protein
LRFAGLHAHTNDVGTTKVQTTAWKMLCNKLADGNCKLLWETTIDNVYQMCRIISNKAVLVDERDYLLDFYRFFWVKSVGYTFAL